MIPNEREYEIFDIGQTRIYAYVAMLTIASPIQFPLLSLNANWNQQKIPRERGTT